ncbi:MAG: hypothetical protein M1352_01090 [Patescibacteria group bacterium]|nr:hypothetical protein [Patescibacteria group bacterium]
MANYSRQVLAVNLNTHEAEYGSYADLGRNIGGLGFALELGIQHRELEPTVLSIGPLTGFFPFASKVCLLSVSSSGLTESYLSGSLSLMLRFAQIDCLLIYGTSKQPVFVSVHSGGQVDFLEGEAAEPLFYKSGSLGRRSFLAFTDGGSLADNYFKLHDEIGRRLYRRNLLGLVVSADRTLNIAKEKDYSELCREILERGRDLEVSYSNQPSCALCPAGCNFSKETEERPELVLSHCLVTCGFAKNIYENVPLAFACLNSLGYPFLHEDLEGLEKMVAELRAQF